MGLRAGAARRRHRVRDPARLPGTTAPFGQPEDLSPLVADLYRWWYRQRGIPANRLLVDSFMLLDPWWTLRTGSVPYWTAFPVQPSLATLHHYLDREAYDHLHLALFCHGVESVGMVTADQWRALLLRAGVAGTFAGVSPDRYPSDLDTFFGFPRAVRAIPGRHEPAEPLSLRQCERFLAEGADRYPGVTMDAGERHLPDAG